MTTADPAARRELVIPIFPLPDVTLFPHTVLPLHVFEARYRAMITDALARDRLLAVARLLPGYEATYAGKPPVASVAGAGEIVKWERLPGGRYNILVEGRWRGGKAQGRVTDEAAESAGRRGAGGRAARAEKSGTGHGAGQWAQKGGGRLEAKTERGP